MFAVSLVSKAWAEQRRKKLWYQPQTSSTNDIAKKNPAFEVYITAEQSAGRGQSHNTWQARSDETLLMSWNYFLPAPAQHISGPLFGLALFRAVQKYWPELSWSIKRPNDLFLHSKKIAGLLLESISMGEQHRLIVGLGFNLFSHPEDLPMAGHLCEFLPTPPNEDQWLEFLQILDAEFNQAQKNCQKGLSNTEQSELLKALNAHPLLRAPFERIDAEANLYSAGKKLSWRN